MLRPASFLAVLGSLVIALPAPLNAQEDSRLEGAWQLVELKPPGEKPVTDPQPGLHLFTETHYSVMVATSDSTRVNLPEEPTDAEIEQAYNSFSASAGRYEVKGDTIITRAYVSKNPNRMNAFPNIALKWTYRIDGDTLHMTLSGFGTSATFRRVEGEPASYR